MLAPFVLRCSVPPVNPLPPQPPGSPRLSCESVVSAASCAPLRAALAGVFHGVDGSVPVRARLPARAAGGVQCGGGQRGSCLGSGARAAARRALLARAPLSRSRVLDPGVAGDSRRGRPVRAVALPY